MEKQQNMNTSRENEHTVIESFNQMQQNKSVEDLMYQRMKNRERQRRYRERKRLLADMNKSVTMNDLTPLPLPPPPSPPPATSSELVPYQCATRVRCTRDWKKDARRAHAAKQKVANALPQDDHCITNGNQVSRLVSEMKEREHNSKEDISTRLSAMENGEKSKSKSSRRDWKAEARNRKGETK